MRSKLLRFVVALAILASAFLASARAYERADICTNEHTHAEYACSRSERFFIALTSGMFSFIYWASVYWEDQ